MNGAQQAADERSAGDHLTRQSSPSNAEWHDGGGELWEPSLPPVLSNLADGSLGIWPFGDDAEFDLSFLLGGPDNMTPTHNAMSDAECSAFGFENAMDTSDLSGLAMVSQCLFVFQTTESLLPVQ